MPAPHVVLLGDSVFDNRAYVGAGLDVAARIRSRLPAEWTATLCAVDGSRSVDLAEQTALMPAGATHAVVSVGGNDALSHWGVLRQPVATTADALEIWGRHAAAFEARYRDAVSRIVATGARTAVCTIYDGRLDSIQKTAALVAVVLFNDVILRTARDRGLGVIDLRTICTAPDDYATPIEPSAEGGRKIAEAITLWLTQSSRAPA